MLQHIIRSTSPAGVELFQLKIKRASFEDFFKNYVIVFKQREWSGSAYFMPPLLFSGLSQGIFFFFNLLLVNLFCSINILRDLKFQHFFTTSRVGSLNSSHLL